MFVTEYDDFVMVAKQLKEGSYVVIAEDNERNTDVLSATLGIIKKVVTLSSMGEDYYKEDKLLSMCDDYYDYSAEFVTDNDCYYIFAIRCDSI